MVASKLYELKDIQPLIELKLSTQTCTNFVIKNG